MPAADEIDPEVEKEVEAARLLLRRLLVATGWRHQELDARLGFAPGSMSRLLTGGTRLLYSHILRILRAIQVEPHFFFDALHRTRAAARGVRSADLRRQAQEWGLDGAVAADVPLRRPVPVPDAVDLEQTIIQAIELALAQQGLSRGKRDQG